MIGVGEDVPCTYEDLLLSSKDRSRDELSLRGCNCLREELSVLKHL
jgi:hypothetical protein